MVHYNSACKQTIMYSLVSLIVLGYLGLSMGLPVEQAPNSVRYNPEDFYAPWRVQESSGRIVGGWEAPDAFAQHMVAIKMGFSLISLVCGGGLVNSNAVLTAAHCIEPLIRWDNPDMLMDTVRGQIGSNSLSRDYQVVEFSKFLIHPDWDRMTIKSDVGIMWLTEHVPKNILAQPIALSFEQIGGGEPLTVTGWGRLNDDVIVVDPRKLEKDHRDWDALPDRLQKLEVRSLTHEECLAGVQEARDELGFAPEVDAAVEMCTMHPLGAGQGMCNGDSGSALWLEKRDKHNRVRRVAVAIVSWGFPCARGYPDVHGRIGGFKDFLVSNLKLSASDYEE